jgi:arylsulfatase A-like enzyme
MAQVTDCPAETRRLPLPRWPAAALAWAGRLLWHPPGAGDGAAPTHRRGAAEVLSLVLAVCLAIVVTKCVLAIDTLSNLAVRPIIWDDEEFWPSVGRALACCAEDFAVGLVCLLLAALAVRLCRRPFHFWALRLGVYTAALVALFLLAVNVHLFQRTRFFLTVSQIETSTHFDFNNGLVMEGSVEEAVSTPVKLTLALLPLGTVALHLWLVWLMPRFWTFLAWCLCRPALLALAIPATFFWADTVQSGEFFDVDTDFVRSPHLVLARSYLGESGLNDVPVDPDADVSDFLAGNPRLHGNLPLARRPRNIVVIVLESVSTTYMDLHNGPWPLNPRLKKLEQEGKALVFDNFYATANHSIASGLPLFGSVYNDTRYTSTVIQFKDFPVPAAATHLKKQGYKTYFLAGGGSSIWEKFYNMVPAFVANDFYDVARDPAHPFWAKTPEPDRFFSWYYQDKAIFTDARRVLDDAATRDGPFYLMIWNYGTHWPYTPEKDVPVPLDTKHYPPSMLDGGKYQEEFTNFLKSIYAVDTWIADFYEELERRGLAEDTLIVVTGDHGEAFGQHVGYLHGYSVYEEEVHVPLILLNPHVGKLDRRPKVIGSHVDMWPTIMDVCGLPCDPRWQGRSLFGGDPTEERRAYFYSRSNGHIGVRQGKWKYIWDGGKRRDLLFDLEADPLERTNLVEDYPELTHQLKTRVAAWRQYQVRFTEERLAAVRGQ